MVPQVNEYLKAMDYEIIIRRAFNYPQGHRQIGFWQNDFEKVKDKVGKAVDKFLSKRLSDKERNNLTNIKHRLIHIYEKELLYPIIHDLLEATRRLK